MYTENDFINELQTSHPDFWVPVGESLSEITALPQILFLTLFK